MPARVTPAAFVVQKRRYRRRTGSGTGPRLFEPWTGEEDRKVLAHARPDRELADEIGRSITAISVRRCRLRALDEQKARTATSA